MPHIIPVGVYLGFKVWMYYIWMTKVAPLVSPLTTMALTPSTATVITSSAIIYSPTQLTSHHHQTSILHGPPNHHWRAPGHLQPSTIDTLQPQLVQGQLGPYLCMSLQQVGHAVRGVAKTQTLASASVKICILNAAFMLTL